MVKLETIGEILVIIVMISGVVYWLANYVFVERKPLPNTWEKGYEQEECAPNYMGGCD